MFSTSWGDIDFYKLEKQSKNIYYLTTNLACGPLMMEKMVKGFFSWNLVWVLVTILARKYQPICVSESVSDLNQNSDLGRTQAYSNPGGG